MKNLDTIFRTMVDLWTAHDDATRTGDFEAMITTKQRLDSARVDALRQLRLS